MATNVDLLRLLGDRRHILRKLGLRPHDEDTKQTALAAEHNYSEHGDAAVPHVCCKREQKQLNAIARVLRETGAPMRIRDIARTVLKKGYWSGTTKGAENCLRTSLYRDIFRNGDRSRFRKTQRGVFALAEHALES